MDKPHGHLKIHEEQVQNDGTYFCRCMNRNTKDTRWLCECCPMFCGKAETTACRYADGEDEFPDYWFPDEPSRGIFDAIPQKAIKFAAVAHKGQTRKGNGLPYIIHPMETMYIVAQMTDDVEVMAAAALHDVLEDTKCVGRDIEARFGRRVAELVGMESEDKKRHRPAKDTWHERKEENLLRERRSPLEAKLIMLSDKLSNVRSTLRDYEKMGAHVWDKFNMKDPTEQEWYYRTVAEVVKELSDTSVFREYVQILDTIFPESP